MLKLSLARPAVALAAMILACASWQEAAAQASFTVGADSDYRLRGISLSNEKAVARAGLAYDHETGAYAGAVAVVGTDYSKDPALLGGTVYAGYARKIAAGVTADAGLTATRITTDLEAPRPPPNPYANVYTPAPYSVRYRADYAEAYAGLSRGDVSAYVYLSPNYLSPGQATAYVEVNAAAHLANRLRVFGHAGLLAPLDNTGPYGLRSRADTRIGVALELDRLEVQLAWTSISRQVAYPAGYPRDRDGVVLSATAYF